MASAHDSGSKKDESYTVLIAHFGTMWHEKIHPDIKLKTKDGGEYPAHKCVLSARSPVFANLLSDHKQDCLDIFNVGCDNYVTEMLRYMYSGFVGEFNWKIALAVYTLAARYQLQGLKNVSSSYLKEHVTLDSAPTLKSLAFATDDDDLRDFAKNFIKKHTPTLGNRLKYLVSPGSFAGPSQMQSSDPGEQSLAIKEELVKDFKKMIDCSIHSDIKLKTNSGEFPAHKCVLAARSPVFKTLLANYSNSSLDMEDMKGDTVSRMLRYFYTGQVEDLTMDSAVTLYVAAGKYGFALPLVKRLCLSYLTEHLGPSNAHDTLQLLQLHPDEELKNFIFSLIMANVKEYEKGDLSQLMHDAILMHLSSLDSGSSSSDGESSSDSD